MAVTVARERFRQVRKEQGMTQSELAALVGSTQAQVSKWERGKSDPNEECRSLLAEALYLSVAEVDQLLTYSH